MLILYLAARNVLLQRKRFSLMALAVAIGFLLVTLMTGLSAGALTALQEKAARYFAGHVSIVGYQHEAGIPDPTAVMDALRQSQLPIRTVAPRAVYYRGDARLFFSGNSVRQRRITGVDLTAEYPELSGLPMVDGSLQGMLGPGRETAVVISNAAAHLLGARVGDDVTLLLSTDQGQITSATLLIAGIFRDEGIFGFTAYLHNRTLNALVGRAPDAATDIAVYASRNRRGLAAAVHQALSGRFPLFPLPQSKQQLEAMLAAGNPDATLAVISLEAHLAEIQQMIHAFQWVTYLVLALFMVIVVVGILNTWRVLMHQRIREIGTLRAFGMPRFQVGSLFLWEAAFIALAASAAGLLASLPVSALLARIPLGGNPAVDMLTRHGRLVFELNPVVVVANLLAMTAAVLAGAWLPARAASRVEPAAALRTDR